MTEATPPPAPPSDAQAVPAGGEAAAALLPTEVVASVVPQLPPAPAGKPSRAAALRLAAVFVAALVACALAYLALAVPGKWFSGAQTLAWGARDLQVTRGTGRIVGDELHVLPNDPSGIIVVSVVTKFASADLAQVAWIAIDVPDDIEISALWRSDYKPDALNTLPLPALGGRLLPAAVVKHAAWIGRIEGLALAFRGPIAEPIRVRGVIVRPLDAPEIAKERVREWFAFEGWTGTSINTLTGGADLQDLPLPLLLATAAAVAGLAVTALRRWRPHAFPLGALGSLMVFALVAWLLLDLRWAWNLARQVEQTAATFAFRGFDEKRLAVEDGPLYAFVVKAREAMPKEPVRVFVVADSHYFRGRAAYHLSPHRAFFDPRANTLPVPEALRPGDWLLVYQRKGVLFDSAQGKLRWSNLAPVSADLKLAGRGAALFQIR